MMRRPAGFDGLLVAATLALLATSALLLLTAITNPATGHVDHSFGIRQVVYMVPGIVLALLAASMPLERLAAAWMPLWLAAVAAIGVVFVLGTAIRGSRRWIELGPINIQPSEVGKVLLLLSLAGLLASRSREISSARLFATTIALGAVPGLMVFIQPDFGTSQIYFYTTFALLFFAGARWLHFAVVGSGLVVLLVLVLGVLPAVNVNVLHDYQIKRFTGFLDPEADPRGANYQAIQAKIAIGSGGLGGKPAKEASQVRKAFLPEPQTDFIFATLSERHGFIGGAVVLMLFVVLILRCLHGVVVAPTLYGRLVCGGVAAMFASQVVTNVGMVIGLMPITGVPLPLVSYGGSAMLANLVAVGLVLGVIRSAEAAPVRYARRVGPTLAAARSGTLDGRGRPPRIRRRSSR